MNAKEFIFWLQGYLAGVNKETKPIEEIVDEITEKSKEVDLNEEIIEKIIEREIDKTPVWPFNPHYPENPTVPPFASPFTITMYGCIPTQYRNMPTPDSGGGNKS